MFYQKYFKESKSIHLTSFPEFDSNLVDDELEKKGDSMIKYLEEVRKIKTEIEEFKIMENIGGFEKDLKETGNIKNIIKA